MFDVKALAAAILKELEAQPLTLDALIAKLHVSRDKVKVAIGGLESDNEIHRRQHGPQSPIMFYLGGRPAPPPPSHGPEGDDELHCVHPLAERWTTGDDLMAHAIEQIDAGLDARTNFKEQEWAARQAEKLSTDEVSLEEASDQALDQLGQQKLLAIGIKSTIISSPSGDHFVAVPNDPEPDDPEHRRPGRTYVRVKTLDAAERLLKFAPDSGWSPIEDGKKKSPARILSERSIVATGGIVLDGVANCSHLDSEKKFHLKCWGLLPDVVPQRSPRVEAWLRTWGDAGMSAIYDFVATCRILKWAAPILLLKACPGSGKDLLTLALARLFRQYGGPCAASAAAANFNADLQHSPIIMVNEKLPETWNGLPFDLEVLKRLVTEFTREINEKFVAKIPQLGHTRWVFGTNMRNPFPTDIALERESLDALLARVLYVEAPIDPSTGRSGPAAWLATEGGFKLTENWIQDSKGRPGPLTRHLRWILEEHKIARPDPTGRFACAPDAGRLANVLRASTRVTSLVIAGIVEFLVGDHPKQNLGRAIRPGGGRCLVQIARLHDAWAALTATAAASGGGLDARRVAPVLSQFAREIGESLCLPGDIAVEGDARTWRAVRVDLLLEHAADVGLPVAVIAARIKGEPSNKGGRETK